MKLFIYEWASAGGMGPRTPPSLRDEGWAMLTALVEDFERVENVQTFTLLDTLCPKSLGHFCRRIGPGEEQAGFQEMLARTDWVLVIAPESDQILADRSHRVLEAGKILLGSSLDAIRLSADKFALAQHFYRQAIRSPLTIFLDRDDIDLTEIPFPAVCKPRHGAGSQATLLVPTVDDLSPILAHARRELSGSEFLLQPFIPGLPASVTFLIGPKQRLALRPSAQYISADGRFHYRGGRVPLAEPLAQRACALGQKAMVTVAGLAGFVGVDLILGAAADGSQDYLVEINPRPTTSYIGLRRLTEDNLAESLLRIAHGEEIIPLRWRPGVIEFSSNGMVK